MYEVVYTVHCTHYEIKPISRADDSAVEQYNIINGNGKMK